ncbi:hypothetical protein C9374_001270 [Naegleria lovaniensis]|uniref:Uncharacterized protein n=1 Tax=Naegleria lovaniensis TaxID=51637 RepID=A0AA88GSQ3_NAELO|nr:uncharacterized protein C9374_001270 [Naegleria lovaniensis]KAG2387676.1 hypothetical protein C9374_001270 [Naegleria lovaniensis]
MAEQQQPSLSTLLFRYSAVMVLCTLSYLIHNQYIENNFNKQYEKSGWIMDLEQHYAQFAKNTTIIPPITNDTEFSNSTFSNLTSQFKTFSLNIDPTIWPNITQELESRVLTAVVVQFYSPQSVYSQKLTEHWKELTQLLYSNPDMIRTIRICQYNVNSRQAYIYTKSMIGRGLITSFPSILLFYANPIQKTISTKSFIYDIRSVSLMKKFIENSLDAIKK